MIALLDRCLGDMYLTKDKATLPWQASELSLKLIVFYFHQLGLELKPQAVMDA